LNLSEENLSENIGTRGEWYVLNIRKSIFRNSILASSCGLVRKGVGIGLRVAAYGPGDYRFSAEPAYLKILSEIFISLLAPSNNF
jgi:hypothetical protein